MTYAMQLPNVKDSDLARPRSQTSLIPRRRGMPLERKSSHISGTMRQRRGPPGYHVPSGRSVNFRTRVTQVTRLTQFALRRLLVGMMVRSLFGRRRAFYPVR